MKLVDDLVSLGGRVTREGIDLAQGALTGTVLRGARAGLDLARQLPTLLPKDLDALYRSALDEVRAELEEIPEQALRVDVAGLMARWGKVLAGRGSEADRKALDRLREAFRAKARYGAEYFVAPGSVAVAPTKRHLVHRSGTLSLFRYERTGGPVKPAAKAPPVLLVYSLINRSYILDLMEGASFVAHLLDQGLDVFIVEWGEAKKNDRETTLDRWLLEDLPSCVSAIRTITRKRRVSLLGHCMGGVFAAAYAGLHPKDVDRLLAITTPFTAAEGGLVALWTDRRLFPVDALVDGLGLMPGKLIRLTFLTLKPWYEVMRWRIFLDNAGNDAVMRPFLAADAWVNDNPDLHGEVYRKFAKSVYFEDGLRKGTLGVGDRTVGLGDVRCPVMNVAATRDWVVPKASVNAANALFGSKDVRAVEVGGAHVSLFFDPRLFARWNDLSAFLKEPAAPRKRRTS